MNITAAEVYDNFENGTASNFHVLQSNLRHTWQVVLLSATLLFIIITAFLGNLMVIYAIYQTPRLREQINYIFLINLGVSDLCNSILVMTTSLVMAATNGRHVPVHWCRFNCMANYELIIVSMLTLAGISIDRYQAIMHPFEYSTRMTQGKVLVMVLYPWLQGLAFALAPVAMDWIEYDYAEVVCAISWQREKQQAVYYVIVAFIICFLAPGLVMLFAYISIMREVKRSNTSGAPANIAKATRKTLRSLLIVVLCFFICMTPFCVTKLLKVILADSAVPGYANEISTLFQYMSSVVNPFIYAIFRKDFRDAFYKIFWAVTCRKCASEPNAPNDLLTSMSATVNQPNSCSPVRKDRNEKTQAPSCNHSTYDVNPMTNSSTKCLPAQHQQTTQSLSSTTKNEIVSIKPDPDKLTSVPISGLTTEDGISEGGRGSQNPDKTPQSSITIKVRTCAN